MENMELSKTGKYDRSRLASVYGYSDNKTIRFKYINGIYIDKFRSLHKRQLKLGKFITLITGKNGTMKSSILGLIAHPFTSPNGAKDMYGKDLKTNYSDVFHLSMDKDSNEYVYYHKKQNPFYARLYRIEHGRDFLDLYNREQPGSKSTILRLERIEDFSNILSHLFIISRYP